MTFARFCQQEFGEFPRPAWAVGSYCSGPPAGGTPQIIVDKTLRMTSRLRVYSLYPFHIFIHCLPLILDMSEGVECFLYNQVYMCGVHIQQALQYMYARASFKYQRKTVNEYVKMYAPFSGVESSQGWRRHVLLRRLHRHIQDQHDFVQATRYE